MYANLFHKRLWDLTTTLGIVIVYLRKCLALLRPTCNHNALARLLRHDRLCSARANWHTIFIMPDDEGIDIVKHILVIPITNLGVTILLNLGG